MKILIITITVVVLSAVIATIIIGKQTFDGTVEEKPYEQGLLWDKIRSNKYESGWSAVINNRKFKKGDDVVSISVFDKYGKPLSDASVFLVVSRPSTTTYDRNYETMRRSDNSYAAKVYFPLFGYWDIKITVAKKGESVIFEERIFAEEEQR
ncbi:MAG: FixH family protein [Nitrospirae bacterium]|nr:FixH family protein [Nitrospirota bacterium]